MYRGVGDDTPLLNILPNAPASAAGPAPSISTTPDQNMANQTGQPCSNWFWKMKAIPKSLVLTLSGCFTGQAPAGISAPNFSAFCSKAQACGVFTRPGAAGVDAALNQIYPLPSCFDDAASASQSYCSQYGSSGPDPTSNALCWVAGRSAKYWTRFLAVPPCNATLPAPPAPPGGGTTSGGGGGGGGAAGPAAAPDRTMLYVAGGLGVLAIGGLYLALRKR
jgi:hypothetical protein